MGERGFKNCARKANDSFFCLCLSNKSPSQATLHKASCTYYPWLSKALLQLLVFSRQLLDLIISSSLLQRDSCCRKRYGKSLASFYSSKYNTEDRIGWDCNDSGYICYRPIVTSVLKVILHYKKTLHAQSLVLRDKV